MNQDNKVRTFKIMTHRLTQCMLTWRVLFYSTVHNDTIAAMRLVKLLAIAIEVAIYVMLLLNKNTIVLCRKSRNHVRIMPTMYKIMLKY